MLRDRQDKPKLEWILLLREPARQVVEFFERKVQSSACHETRRKVYQRIEDLSCLEGSAPLNFYTYLGRVRQCSRHRHRRVHPQVSLRFDHRLDRGDQE